jgi:hypothetical protein
MFVTSWRKMQIVKHEMVALEVILVIVVLSIGKKSSKLPPSRVPRARKRTEAYSSSIHGIYLRLRTISISYQWTCFCFRGKSLLFGTCCNGYFLFLLRTDATSLSTTISSPTSKIGKANAWHFNRIKWVIFPIYRFKLRKTDHEMW